MEIINYSNENYFGFHYYVKPGGLKNTWFNFNKPLPKYNLSITRCNVLNTDSAQNRTVYCFIFQYFVSYKINNLVNAVENSFFLSTSWLVKPLYLIPDQNPLINYYYHQLLRKCFTGYSLKRIPKCTFIVFCFVIAIC